MYIFVGIFLILLSVFVESTWIYNESICGIDDAKDHYFISFILVLFGIYFLYRNFKKND